MEHYLKALEINPNYNEPDLFNNLGIIYLNNKQIKEAIAEFSKCLALNPQNKNAIQNMVNAQQMAGNMPEAVRYSKMLNN